MLFWVWISALESASSKVVGAYSKSNFGFKNPGLIRVNNNPVLVYNHKSWNLCVLFTGDYSRLNNSTTDVYKEQFVKNLAGKKLPSALLHTIFVYIGLALSLIKSGFGALIPPLMP